jgi:hypothetical protein
MVALVEEVDMVAWVLVANMVNLAHFGEFVVRYENLADSCCL